MISLHEFVLINIAPLSLSLSFVTHVVHKMIIIQEKEESFLKGVLLIECFS
jgi:hypothetical protein